MTVGGHILRPKEGIRTPPLDRTTRIILAIAAVAGLLLAFVAAVTGSALLASVSAVASATAATIAIGVARRGRATGDSSKKPTPTVPVEPLSGTRPPVIPASDAEASVAGGGLDEAYAPLARQESLEPAAVLRELSEALEPVGTVVSAHLWLLDPATDSFRLIEAIGPLPPAALPVSREDSILGRAIADALEVIGPLERRRGPSADMSYWRLAIPLWVGDQAGVVAVDLQGDSAPDRALLTAEARRARGALIAALAAHVGHQEVEAARQLLEAAQELSRLVDPTEVLKTILSHAVGMFHADTGSVMLANEMGSALTIAAAEGLAHDIVQSTVLPKGEGIAGIVFASGKSLVVEDPPGRATLSRRHGIRSAISVPIADAEGSLGVLNVGNSAYSTMLSQTALSSLESLGMIGASALRHARAVEHGRRSVLRHLQDARPCTRDQGPLFAWGYRARRRLRSGTGTGHGAG